VGQQTRAELESDLCKDMFLSLRTPITDDTHH
jgi:hypothetical protein